MQINKFDNIKTELNERKINIELDNNKIIKSSEKSAINNTLNAKYILDTDKNIGDHYNK